MPQPCYGCSDRGRNETKKKYGHTAAAKYHQDDKENRGRSLSRNRRSTPLLSRRWNGIQGSCMWPHRDRAETFVNNRWRVQHDNHGACAPQDLAASDICQRWTPRAAAQTPRPVQRAALERPRARKSVLASRACPQWSLPLPVLVEGGLSFKVLITRHNGCRASHVSTCLSRCSDACSPAPIPCPLHMCARMCR
jgi:hypothetical protein